MTNSVTFEYQDKGKETPFETFLRYTDEKEQSAKVLAEIIKKIITRENLSFLDIGSGTGKYLSLALNEITNLPLINFVLLEPSKDLVEELEITSTNLPHHNSVKVINEAWEEFESYDKFDVILASHLYHIHRPDYPEQLGKMLSFLNNGGYLIFVMREKADDFNFRVAIKPKILNKSFNPKFLDEAIKVFESVAQDQSVNLNIKRFVSKSKLTIPLSDNFEDATSIMEFLLNKKWQEIPTNIQQEAIDFVKAKNEQFEQIDGIVLIKKL